MKTFYKFCCVVVLGLFVFNVSNLNAQRLFFGNPLEGKQAPDFTLPDLEGKNVNMTEYREGKNTILFFWATWCPHCRKAIDDLDKDSSSIENKDVKIMIIDVGESMELVRSYIKKRNIKLDIFVDEQSSLSQDYGLVGLPTFVYIDKKGIVKSVGHSLVDNLDEVFSDK